MDDSVLTAMVVANSVISLAIFYVVAPLSKLKGTVCQIKETLVHHEHRLLSIEERV